MKYLLAIILLASCGNYKKRNMIVYQSNGSGFNLSTCYIQVDSVTVTTPNSATFWIDGRKTTVYAERIMIGENR